MQKQPPSGGCVLKLLVSRLNLRVCLQPPSGGCVLKRQHLRHAASNHTQPPSGGCVLKPKRGFFLGLIAGVTAAFRRLCVETEVINQALTDFLQPPSGGCVLKHIVIINLLFIG